MTFQELHRTVLKAKKDNTPLPENLTDREQHQLDCLLHPDEHPLVWKTGNCECTDGKCAAACTFAALEIKDGQVTFDPEKCTGCAKCIEACQNQNLTFSHDSVKALELLKMTAILYMHLWRLPLSDNLAKTAPLPVSVLR